MIRRPGGVLKGDGIYNSNAQGQSIYGGSYPAGTVRYAYIYVQNDGDGPFSYYFMAAGAAVTGFSVRYLTTSGMDITAIVEAGNWSALINPGQRAAIRARIEITGAAAHGAQFGRLITVGPFGFGAGSDTVGFSFKRQ